jgi:hypothetical protein
MKFNLFSSKKKNNKTDLNDATDFLNPADISSAEGLSQVKKFRKKSSSSSNALKANIETKQKKTEQREVKKIKKIKKEDNKDKVKKPLELSKVSKKESNLNIKEEKSKIKPNDELLQVNREEEIEEIISEFEKEKQSRFEKKETIKPIKELVASKSVSDKVKKSKPSSSNDSIFIKSRIQEMNKGFNRDDFLNQDKILEINLVKDQISVFFDWYKNLAFLFIFIFLSFLLVVEVYWALSWWQNYNQNSFNYNHNSNSLISLSQEIREIKAPADEALVFEKQLARVAYLLDSHIYWTEFFNYLEDNTLEGVKYTNFSGNLSGKYSLSSIASDYPLVGRQAQRYFSSDLSRNVSVNSASLQTQSKTITSEGPDGEIIEEEETSSSVSFGLDLEISSEVFKK